MIKKIISGGQTGADQAGLDAAIDFGIDHGGWIPKGRLTEAGILPEKYHLEEMQTKSYPKRTEKNIISSDGTIIISRGQLSGGSALTKRLAIKHKKPFLHLDLKDTVFDNAVVIFSSWVYKNNISVLNVAGPRDSKDTAIYNDVYRLLTFVLNNII